MRDKAPSFPSIQSGQDGRGNCRTSLKPLPDGRGSETTTAYRAATVRERSFGEYCNDLSRLALSAACYTNTVSVVLLRTTGL
jgi:hypothetical protein